MKDVLYLPRLYLADLLGRNVNTTQLRTKHIQLNILGLLLRVDVLDLSARGLEEVLGRKVSPSDR